MSLLHMLSGPVIPAKTIPKARQAMAVRRERITEYVRKEGKVATSTIFTLFTGVAARTIEDTIRALVEDNVIERVGHGYVQLRVRGG